MIRIKPVLSAGALLLASVAAHAVDTTYTFNDITSVQHSPAGTGLTGVLVNETTPTSITVPHSDSLIGNRCAKQFDLMLKKQGKYTLSVTIRATVPEFPPGATTPVSSLYSCLVELKP